MAYMIHDIIGLAAAILMALPIFVMPAYALAWQFDLFSVRSKPPHDRLAIASMLAYAVMPLFHSIGGRFLGLRPMAALSLCLAGLMMYRVRETPLPQISRRTWAYLAAALLLLALVWVDVSWNGRLYPTLLVIDLVKHAATVRSLVETGATPPIDPFFLRDQAASYYYFFYTPAALIEIVSGGLVDSRAAVGGMVFWTGIATVTLARFILDRAGLISGGRSVSVGLLLTLMAAGGLQLLIVSMFVVGFGWPWPAQLGWLRDDFASWPVSMIWVPHHLSGLIASWIGFFALIEAQQYAASSDVSRRWKHVALAGLAFASACGLSTWVTIGAVATLAVWSAVEISHRRFASIAMFAVAGAVALVSAAPHLIDLVHNRSLGAFPIAFEVRMFAVSEIFAGSLGWVAQNLVRAMFLPLHYLLAGGIFFVGSLLYWRRARAGSENTNPVGLVLAYSAAASLFVGSFFQSVVVNNDLGWRVVLFVQMAALLWTAALVEPLWRAVQRTSLAHVVPRMPAVLTLTLLLGYGAAAHDILATRLFPLYGRGAILNPRDPVADYESRDVYGWINSNLGPRVVVQHNPDTQRALGYGLYGRQRTAVADKHNALLFGPSNSEVEVRLRALTPVFNQTQSAKNVAATLDAEHIDTVIVSARDPVWKSKAGWVFATPALYETPSMRVLRVRDLKDNTP